jgi:homoserine kinase type II
MSKLVKVKKTIKNNYSLPDFFQISLLREGPDNDVYLISDHQDKEIMVVRVSKRDVQEDVRFEISWLAELAQKNVPVPEIVKTKDNTPFYINRAQVYVAFKYIKGDHLDLESDSKPRLTRIATAAKALSQMHNASLDIDLDLSRERDILTEINRALDLKDIFIENSEGGEKFIQELEHYKKWAKEKMNKRYLVHNDYRVGNVFFKGDQVKAIIDFDWACQGPAAKDLGHALVEWSYPDATTKQHWTDVFNTFLESYNETAINKIQLDNILYRWICFSCLADTATFFCDRLDSDLFKKIRNSYMYRKFLYFQKKIE